MPVITMNVPCLLEIKKGQDGFGQPVFSQPRKIKCAVIKHTIARQKTTVRVDSSGSIGHADETVADVVVLMPKNIAITLDDVFTVHGLRCRVSSVRSRFDVRGGLDHLEVEGTIE